MIEIRFRFYSILLAILLLFEVRGQDERYITFSIHSQPKGFQLYSLLAPSPSPLRHLHNAAPV